ncbi:MAG: 5-(carboxyamino)imidazole ribonucleotide synthase [Rickettsiella sp.]|nr:5-(carboxyamino)imidazole ribonucleotide synthase [Rickettsiella sp.]
MKVGILGAGQLAQLLAHSAYSLGLETVCFTNNPDVPAARFSPLYIGNIHDSKDLIGFAEQCDVITFENENIAPEIIEFLSQYKPVLPDQKAIKVAQDRFIEKTFLQTLNIPTPCFAAIDSLTDLNTAISNIGLPALLKTRRFGYDGKGQVLLHDTHLAANAWDAIDRVPAILEKWVTFEHEVSLIAARNQTGATIFYPLIKNTHKQGILRFSESPFTNPDLQKLAEYHMQLVFDALDYVGVMAFEFFVKESQLIGNELAPRVHNSGHLTIEGFNASQFENHLRSILDCPLIKPILRASTKMTNIIGILPELTIQDCQNIHFYNYGKTPKPGRKLGHIIKYL